MTVVTAQQMIYKSLRLLGVLTSGETPTAAEAQDSLYTLNSLIDSFSSNPEYYFYTADETISLTNGTGSYTIGTDGVPSLNTTRPIRVVGAFVRNTNNTDFPLGLVTEQYWNNILDKTTPGVPEKLLYRPETPNGRIFLYPVPTANLTLHLRLEKMIAPFASLVSTQDLPPGYQRLLELSLAVDQSAEYGTRVTPETMAYLRQSLIDLTTTNLQKLPSSKAGALPPSNVYTNMSAQVPIAPS
jgi:hypothetical protein